VEQATPPSAITPLIDELRRRVAERRKSGAYPEGLEEELDTHFRRIVGWRAGPDTAGLRALLDVLDVRGSFSPERISHRTTLPGGERIHRTISKVVSRQTQGILEQVQDFADVVREALAKIVTLLEDPHGHTHADLLSELDVVLERLASYERGPVDSAAATADLRRRVEALERAEARHRFCPPYSADAFETAFRGSSDDLRVRYRDLALRFAGHSPVLDIGCGRGEFLELLQGLGVTARGIELDPDLVASARQAGLDVEEGDAVPYLATLPDRSLGGIALIQVIEHLTIQGVVDLVEVARHKLVEGGLIVIETVNPQSIYTFAHSFYLDPTHHNPVHPAYLKFLFDQAGWSRVEIDWRTPPPVGDVLDEDAATTEAQAQNIRRLNELLFAPQDYALIAVR